MRLAVDCIGRFRPEMRTTTDDGRTWSGKDHQGRLLRRIEEAVAEVQAGKPNDLPRPAGER
jgi:hypothetical protein